MYVLARSLTLGFLDVECEELYVLAISVVIIYVVRLLILWTFQVHVYGSGCIIKYLHHLNVSMHVWILGLQVANAYFTHYSFIYN